MPDDLEAARQAIVEFDWRGVVERYLPLQMKAQPGTPAWNEATFAIATAHHQMQPASGSTMALAAEFYDQVVQHGNDPKYVGRAMLNLGRIAELRDYPGDKTDLAAARDWYNKVAARFPGDPIASEATLRAGATLVMAFDENRDFESVRAGISLIEAWITTHPGDPLAPVMWQYVGDTYWRPLADPENALRAYEEVDKLGWPDKGNQGPWYWKAATLADQYLRKPEIAAKYYTKIITETPNSGKAYDAILGLRRLNKPVPPNNILPAATQPTSPSTTQEARP